LTEADIEIILQGAKEKNPVARTAGTKSLKESTSGREGAPENEGT
jgi:hypothetical protein